MKSNYKRLGNYIKLIDVRNRNLEIENLIGLSIQKKFIQSKSNLIGTDMSTYRILNKNQFAYCSVTSRNGEKITIALYQENETAMVSQAYDVFEIANQRELLPEYLMMWFKRSEFDRYSRYMSHGSVREMFSWEEMCEVMLPVPHPNKQKEIVDEYNTILNRIEINNQLIQKLEETAQAIYKQWFVDFEFPDEDEKPYKSSGGEMEFCEKLEIEIPKDWKAMTVKVFCVDMKSGGTPSRDILEYWDSNDIPWLKTGEISNNIIITTEEHISEKGLKMSSAKILPKESVLMSMYGVNAGDLGILKIEAATNQACCGMICENPIHSAYLYFHLLHNQAFISSQSIGGAQENLSKNYIEKFPILKPTNGLLKKNEFKIIVHNKDMFTKEISSLSKMSELLLSKLATIEN